MVKKQYKPHTWVDKRLNVMESPISGRGVFTSSAIKKNEVLMIFGGIVVERINLNEKIYRLQTAFPIDNDTFLVLPLSDTSDTVDEYLNHSCNPSAWLSDEVTVVARRNLKKDEEITLDAATWDTDSEWPYSDDGKCYCNEPTCRKFLSANDYLNPILQKRYKGHFSPFIEKLINK